MDSVEPYDLNGLKDFRYELFSKNPANPHEYGVCGFLFFKSHGISRPYKPLKSVSVWDEIWDGILGSCDTGPLSTGAHG